MLPPTAERQRLLRGLSQPPEAAARFLLGQTLMRNHRGSWLAARIVETEAYLGVGDPAAHTFRGRTPRNAPVWGPPGTVYVYLIYGMYHCLNISVDREGAPGCVLIRAAELLDPADDSVCRGPGKLCLTLTLDRSHSGAGLFAPDATLTLREGRAPRRIGVSPRIGIRQAADLALRFYDRDSRAVSGPRALRAG